MNSMSLDDSSRRSSLSIFVEDVDSKKEVYNRDSRRDMEQKNIRETNKEERNANHFFRSDWSEKQDDENKENTWQASNEAIKQIMAEMEKRKYEFCQLIDEHDALVKHLKAMENKHSSFKIAQQPPIMI